MEARLEYIRKKKYRTLTKYDIRYLRKLKILNGFGGASQSWIVRWLIGWILGDFDTAIPDKHDFSYWQGVYGLLDLYDEETLDSLRKDSPKEYQEILELRRKECDEKFYQAMLDDLRLRYERREIGKWEFPAKLVIANLSWVAIRLRGHEFFNYS